MPAEPRRFHGLQIQFVRRRISFPEAAIDKEAGKSHDAQRATTHLLFFSLFPVFVRNSSSSSCGSRFQDYPGTKHD